ncbi:substrate binding domain-containing protein [Pseudomonas sp. RT6P73]
MPILPGHRRLACASPEYLARSGTPKSPADLSEHSALLYLRNGRPYNSWRFSRNDEVMDVDVRGDYLTDDGEVARRWALAGHGIAYKAWLDVAADVEAGRLVTLFDDWQGEACRSICCARTGCRSRSGSRCCRRFCKNVVMHCVDNFTFLRTAVLVFD